MYLCLAALSIGIFASCKELNGKVLNPAETNQVIEFDVARHSLSGRAGCNRMMGQIEYSDSRKNIIKFPQVATTRMACPDMSGERELLQALDKVVRFDAVGEVKPVNKIALYGTDLFYFGLQGMIRVKRLPFPSWEERVIRPSRRSAMV